MIGLEGIFKKIVTNALSDYNEKFIAILRDIKKSSKVKEVTIVHKGNRFVSKETAAYLIDVSKSWIDKSVEENKLKKHYLAGLKTPRYLESEVLSLVKDKPISAETRKAPRINKKRTRQV